MTSTNGSSANRKARRATRSKKARGAKEIAEALKAQADANASPDAPPDITKMTFVVGGALLQATINYLVTRPYGETYQLIHALQQSKPIDANDTE